MTTFPNSPRLPEGGMVQIDSDRSAVRRLIAVPHNSDTYSRSLQLPFRSGVLQRKCACGGTPGPTGECEACRKKRMSVQRANIHPSSLRGAAHHSQRVALTGATTRPERRNLGERRFGKNRNHVPIYVNNRLATSVQTAFAVAY